MISKNGYNVIIQYPYMKSKNIKETKRVTPNQKKSKIKNN